MEALEAAVQVLQVLILTPYPILDLLVALV
jgi:hypothetical protein